MAAEQAEIEGKEAGESSWLTSLVVVIVVAGLAAAGVYLVFYTEPTASREQRREKEAVLVETSTVETGTYRPRITAMGTVRPNREVVISPRVGGEVVKRSPGFSAGQHVDRGETLVRIDPTDYRNTLDQRKAELRQARSELELERGQQEVAERDLEQYESEISPEERKHVLRKPQLRSAMARVRSARAALRQARVELDRTAVKASFDGHVLERNVSQGSQVSAGQNLGRMIGLDRFWVDVKLPRSDLEWLSLPDTPGGEGAVARITDRTAWEPGRHRTGQLLELVGEVDEASRMVRGRIAVFDPLAVDAAADSPVLMPGAYVRADIAGKQIPDAVRLETEYVRDGEKVWLFEAGQLKIQPVEVAVEDENYAYVTEGLAAGDEVVTSNLSTAVEGLGLRRKENSEETNQLDQASPSEDYDTAPGDGGSN